MGRFDRDINMIKCPYHLYGNEKSGGTFSALKLLQAEGDRKGHNDGSR